MNYIEYKKLYAHGKHFPNEMKEIVQIHNHTSGNRFRIEIDSPYIQITYTKHLILTFAN